MAKQFELTGIEGQLGRIETDLEVLNSRINLKLNSLSDSLNDVSGVISKAFISPIEDESRHSEEERNRIIQKILAGLSVQSSNIEKEADKRQSSILTAIQKRIDQVKSLSSGFGSLVRDTFETQAALVSADFATLTDKIDNTITRKIDPIEDLVSGLGSTIIKSVTSTINPLLEKSAVLIEKTKSLGDRLTEQLKGALDNLPEALATAGISQLTTFAGPLLEFFTLFKAEKWQDALHQSEPIFKLVEEDPDIGPLYNTLSKTGEPVTGIIGIALLVGLIMVLATAPVSAALVGPLAKVEQTSLKKIRPTLLTPVETLELFRRKGIDLDTLDNQLSHAGYSTENIDHLKKLNETLLRVEELIVLWRRNELPEDELDVQLDRLGYTEEKRAHLKKLAFAIPPVQDLITFAVREAFELDVAERFGQLQGLPDDLRQAFNDNLSGFGSGAEGSVAAFAEFAKRSGLAPEWIAAYWAAHWREIGLVQMFQMRQRLDPEVVARRQKDYESLGLDFSNIPFTLEDMQISLRKQDITPFWWDKLLAISYKPITRVDVRRLHLLGLIDDGELVFRYRELGFAPSDANMMAQFTIEYNRRANLRESNETRDLTKSQILDFFENGLIPEDEAFGLLVDIGYSEGAAENLIAIESISIGRKRQTLKIRAIRVRFDAGLIDFNVATTDLDALNLPSVQRDRVLAEIESEVASRIRLPSRGELDSFIDEFLITGAEYQSELLRLGYPENWAVRFRLLHDYTFRGDNEDLLVNPNTGERFGTANNA